MEKSVPEPEVILNKIKHWCAEGEHCSQEVAQRLSKLGYPSHEIPKALALLKKEKFVDDERYARAFARGKFRNLKWGRRKIIAGLRARNVDKTFIALAMEEISEKEYTALIKKEIQKKLKFLSNKDSKSQKAAILRFAISRGYEPEIVNQILGNTLEDDFTNDNNL